MGFRADTRLTGAHSGSLDGADAARQADRGRDAGTGPARAGRHSWRSPIQDLTRRLAQFNPLQLVAQLSAALSPEPAATRTAAPHRLQLQFRPQAAPGGSSRRAGKPRHLFDLVRLHQDFREQFETQLRAQIDELRELVDRAGDDPDAEKWSAADQACHDQFVQKGIENARKLI